jgi:hypothetical protein
MKKITNAAQLKEEIARLETQCALERAALKRSYAEVKEALRPVNLIKSTVKEVGSSTKDVQGRFIGSLLGLAVGYFTRKAVFGKAQGAVRQAAGTLLQMGIAGVVSKNAAGLRTLGSNLLTRILNRKKKERREILDNVDQL